MKQVFLVLFTITSLIHLYDSWNDDSIRRARTKPFLLLLLLLFYVAATKKMNIYLVRALAFSWLGDVLLIPKGHKWFTMGGISFIFSHVFFVLTYLPNVSFKTANWLIVIPMAVIYYGISFFIMYILKPTTPKSMVLPMRFYLLCNSTMNVVEPGWPLRELCCSLCRTAVCFWSGIIKGLRSSSESISRSCWLIFWVSC